VKTLSDCILPHLQPQIGALWPILGPLNTERRTARLQAHVSQRSNRVLTVFENTHHAHNISAVLRSVESFGFLEILFLYSNESLRFRASDSIDRGASQWLLLKRQTQLKQSLRQLKAMNYKIFLVTLPDFSRTSEDYQKQRPAFSCSDIGHESFCRTVGSAPIALVFGSELMGVSQEWHEECDAYLHIPMFGFTESLNVSVCAALLLQRLREWCQGPEQYQHSILSQKDQTLILDYWISKSTTHGRSFLDNRHPHLLPWFDYVQNGQFFLPDSPETANLQTGKSFSTDFST